MTWKLPAKALIGMVHVQALPGTPRGRMSVERIAEMAASEVETLVRAGFDAVMIENMHDRPYVHQEHGPETVAVMTRVGLAVRDASRGVPLGVQVLSGGNREALAVGVAIGASFIRAENYVFAHVGDEGLMAKAEAGPLMRYRRTIGAEGIAVYVDVKKKHASHAITADLGVADAVEAAEFFAADGVIVTGTSTGKPARIEDVAEARGATKLPVLVGSGVTPETVGDVFAYADAVIVGSWYKKGGVWSNGPDAKRCAAMVKAVRAARRA